MRMSRSGAGPWPVLKMYGRSGRLPKLGEKWGGRIGLAGWVPNRR